MIFRISKQELNTSNKQYATNGNLVGNPVFIKEEIFMLSKFSCLAALLKWAQRCFVLKTDGQLAADSTFWQISIFHRHKQIYYFSLFLSLLDRAEQLESCVHRQGGIPEFQNFVQQSVTICRWFRLQLQWGSTPSYPEYGQKVSLLPPTVRKKLSCCICWPPWAPTISLCEVWWTPCECTVWFGCIKKNLPRPNSVQCLHTPV